MPVGCLSGYGNWLHGEAVAAGIIMAAELSAAQGWIEQSLVDRIHSLTERAKLPTTLTNMAAVKKMGTVQYRERLTALDSERFLNLMSMDKKVADGQLSLILLEKELGSCVITDRFDPRQMHAIVTKFVDEASHS